MMSTDNSWQRLLDAELARHSPPPMAGLVESSMRDGRRLCRVTMLRRAGVSLVAVAVVGVTGWTALPRLVQHPASTSVAASSVGPTPGSWPPASAGTTAMEPATPAAMAVLLRNLLPPGQLSEVTASPVEALTVELYHDDGHGPGMLQVTVRAAARAVPAPAGNQISVTHEAGNCIQALLVQVVRADGVQVDVQVSSCLKWNGSANLPGRMVLSDEQTISVATDPRWGLLMPAELVAEGRRDYPRLGSGGGS